MFTIENARQVQKDFRLTDVHVIWYDPAEGFSIAHTDAERASGMDLTDCDFHTWLATELFGGKSCCFPEAGWYSALGVHQVIEGLAF